MRWFFRTTGLLVLGLAALLAVSPEAGAVVTPVQRPWMGGVTQYYFTLATEAPPDVRAGFAGVPKPPGYRFVGMHPGSWYIRDQQGVLRSASTLWRGVDGQGRRFDVGVNRSWTGRILVVVNPPTGGSS